MKKSVLLLSLLFIGQQLFSQKNQLLPAPPIEYGPATFCGFIDHFDLTESKDTSIKLIVTDPFTYFKDYHIPIDSNGVFSIQIPVFGIMHAFINSDLYTGYALLLPNKETKLQIFPHGNGEVRIELTDHLGLMASDLQQMDDVITEILNDDQKIEKGSMVVESISDFLRYSDRYLEISLKQAEERPDISASAKEMTKLCLTTYLLSILHLDYRENMNVDHVESQYFSFLDQYDIGNPRILYSNFLQPFYQKILKDQTLDIPSISTMNIDDWLAQVKSKLQLLSLSESAFLRDMLVTSAFVQQLYDLVPLSIDQEADIRNYFTNQAYTDFLIESDRYTKELIESNLLARKTILMPTPDVPEEQLLQSIIDNHPGKAVLIDFWATWCAPCLSAMDQTAGLKEEMNGKEVVFVYITNPSSPLKVWHEKIHQIGGYHYYLTQEQWEYIMDQQGFSAIPTYFFYDRSGDLQRRETGFSGVDKFRQWLNEVLSAKK